jgi:DNA-binding response OmpR family regulator
MTADQQKIILVTEDEPSMLEIVIDVLKENGFGTIQTRNGEEGLQAALNQHPDLIIVDMLMPKMGGMEMLRKVREDDWGKKVPVIILSNLSPDSNGALKDIVHYQPAYYFIKSDIKLENLIEKIKEMLSPHQKEN